MVLTPDGTAVVCGNVSQGDGTTRCSSTVSPEIAEYSTATGKLTRVVYQHHGPCELGIVAIYWSNASGSAVIADVAVDLPGSPGALKSVIQQGLFSSSGYTELPLHSPGDLFTLLNSGSMVIF